MYFLSLFHLVPFQYRLLCHLGDISVVDRVSLLPDIIHFGYAYLPYKGIFFSPFNTKKGKNMNIEFEQIKHFCLNATRSVGIIHSSESIIFFLFYISIFLVQK